MASSTRQRGRSAPAESEETAPCTSCGAELSRYVNKCPKCGHHAHRLSHDEVYARRESRQKWIIALSALGIGLFFLASALLLRYVNSP